jgi:hypothetical protein
MLVMVVTYHLKSFSSTPCLEKALEGAFRIETCQVTAKDHPVEHRDLAKNVVLVYARERLHMPPRGPGVVTVRYSEALLIVKDGYPHGERERVTRNPRTEALWVTCPQRSVPSNPFGCGRTPRYA